MLKRKPNHYFVKTDLELLTQLFEQLENKGIHTLQDLNVFLKNTGLNSFNDLLKFITSSECSDELAITAEAVLDRLRCASPKRKTILTSSIEVGTYLADKLIGHKQEELWALYIDNSNHIIAEKKLFQGTLNRSIAHPREIFRWAVIYGCSGIFIAHNHPSGKLTPSASDLELTESLRQAAKKAEKVYLASDPDREGEAIAWHLAHILGLSLEDKNRVVFNEITKDAVKAAFKEPRTINLDLVDAQQARRVLDRLVGYSISPILWKKVKKICYWPS